MNENIDELPESVKELEVVESKMKGSITVMYPNGGQMVFNTPMTVDDFNDAYKESLGIDTIMLETEDGQQIINLKHAILVRYGDEVDMEQLKAELQKRQEAAEARSKIINPNKVNPKPTAIPAAMINPIVPNSFKISVCFIMNF